MTAWNNVQLKIWGCKAVSEIRVFAIFLEFASLVFFDIAQDCSLRQCLTSSRTETSKEENIVAQIRAWQVQIRAEEIFFVLLLRFQSNLLVMI